MVEIGGEVRTKGVNAKGQAWQIGIEKPAETADAEQQVFAIASLSGKCMTTSGNARHYSEVDGKRYGHIIDVRTGAPIQNNILSVTVISDKAVIADGYDTPLVIMGLDSAMEFCKRNQLETFIIYKDDNGKVKWKETEGLKEVVKVK